MIFESKIPYPKLEVETKNYAYANLLRKAYASETSEDTAIHMYLYQSLILQKEYMEQKKLSTQEEINQMVHGFDKLNDIGIKSTNYILLLNLIMEIIIFCVICIIR